MIIDPRLAVRAVLDYNSGTYRGKRNLDVDREAYARFAGGVPTSEGELVDLIAFVGDDYGGAQRRFLPHGYRDEAALIVNNLRPTINAWRQILDSVGPLGVGSPSEGVLAGLLTPFIGTKRWPVWASKTLHFFRPKSFPILDSRAKKGLGVPNLGSTPKDYARFAAVFHSTLVENQEAMEAARRADEGASPSDVKLLDKILYQVGI
jgi:hypothetical protein